MIPNKHKKFIGKDISRFGIEQTETSNRLKEVMFSPLSVFLFVCLCTGYLKRLRTDPDEILWTSSVSDKD